MEEEGPLSLYWMTIAEAVDYHFENTPRVKPLNISNIYRWISDHRHPVEGRRFANQLYVGRLSLEEFCRDGYDSSPRRNNKP